MIGLSAVEFDVEGSTLIATLPDQSPFGARTRRVNRTATLDGGSAFNDFGYSDTDGSIELRWRPKDAEDEARIDRIFRLHSRVTVSTRSGVFLAAPQQYTPGITESKMTLFIVARLS